MHRRLTATLAAIALALGGAVAVATPASAGQLVYRNGGPGNCYEVRSQRDSLGRAQVTVWWHCDQASNVKVIWKNGPDSGCNTMSVINRKFSDSSGVASRFDRLVSC
ncbi:hypothetical protein C5C74_14075 [Rathayibacter sp. AY1E8]|uniref:hypothetical protein n=1 Tax=unclassified Rathayibacter TaxID=2609250 RepID=UPI000CE7B312|nr:MULTISPECIES: hypothetical protein [unclassified Rathayibacter]PPG14160.1 hypothetical protein C5C74_14075 [Rathayibacter sp. AY1E8]PPH05287.1 hypothetical protein C5C44_04145 [Rathayibacter sp. AY1F6]